MWDTLSRWVVRGGARDGDAGRRRGGRTGVRGESGMREKELQTSPLLPANHASISQLANTSAARRLRSWISQSSVLAALSASALSACALLPFLVVLGLGREEEVVVVEGWPRARRSRVRAAERLVVGVGVEVGRGLGGIVVEGAGGGIVRRMLGDKERGWGGRVEGLVLGEGWEGGLRC